MDLTEVGSGIIDWKRIFAHSETGRDQALHRRARSSQAAVREHHEELPVSGKRCAGKSIEQRSAAASAAAILFMAGDPLGFMQVRRTPKTYDVCIIGSGAAGGTAAKVLTEGGLSVALLEAGPPLIPERDYKEHVWPYELPHRGAGVGGRARQGLDDEFLAPNGAWEIEGEPYVSAPGSKFRWFRSRIVGGRTNHWGRIALRMAPVDFKVRSHDGMGDDWPISYEDVAPYYDKVESYIGVFGTKENIPSAPDGVFLPPPKPRCTETIVKKACDQLNILCIPSRLAILTKPHNGRAACHYCAQCGRGCITASNFSSSQVMIPPAEKTGRFTLITGAMARELVVGKDGKVDGGLLHRQGDAGRKAHSCAGFHRRRQRLRIRAAAAEFKVHALSRWPGEFLRRGRPQPDGYAWAAMAADISRNSKRCPRTITMASAACTCICHGGSSIARTISCAAITPSSAADAACPGVGDYDDLCDEFEGYGVSLKQECKKKYGTYIGFAGRGEMIPNENCYCEIDPERRRSVGHPGASLPLEVERQRNQDGERYAGNLSRNRGSRRRNLHASERNAGRPPSLRNRRRRRHHSRSRHGAHGRASRQLRR